MDPGEQTTGTRDEQYNLVSVLYHTLKAADICDLYALDAEAGGRTELYEFFREAQVAHTQLAERAKELLGISVDAPPGADIAGPQAMPEEAGLPPEAPPESDLPVDVPAGDAPPRPAGGIPPELVPDEDVAGPEIPPDAPRTGEVPPRTGEFPPSPPRP